VQPERVAVGDALDPGMTRVACVRLSRVAAAGGDRRDERERD